MQATLLLKPKTPNNSQSKEFPSPWVNSTYCTPQSQSWQGRLWKPRGNWGLGTQVSDVSVSTLLLSTEKTAHTLRNSPSMSIPFAMLVFIKIIISVYFWHLHKNIDPVMWDFSYSIHWKCKYTLLMTTNTIENFKQSALGTLYNNMYN